MAHITFDETKLKELFKTALLELVQEEKEVFSEIVAEVLEDIGLENAIKEGENTELVSREEIFKVLNRANES